MTIVPITSITFINFPLKIIADLETPDCSINHYLKYCNIVSAIRIPKYHFRDRHNLKTALIAFVKYACQFFPKTMGTSLDSCSWGRGHYRKSSTVFRRSLKFSAPFWTTSFRDFATPCSRSVRGGGREEVDPALF
ncbi:hypothetical protein CDAR_318441 [Caerostris darwini]|uniref:Uncharacterized protein n=1 Tax=Caerostris darwini TaxID=1538125 RepID=A0AAV4PWH5_9ARAC|nr:hypothetical protein CDAR_318441 [Caerostris darwini]